MSHRQTIRRIESFYHVSIAVVSKYGALFVGTDVVERLVKDGAEFFTDDVQKCLVIFLINETVGEDSEALMKPKPRHGRFGVMLVLV